MRLLFQSCSREGDGDEQEVESFEVGDFKNVFDVSCLRFSLEAQLVFLFFFISSVTIVIIFNIMLKFSLINSCIKA